MQKTRHLRAAAALSAILLASAASALAMPRFDVVAGQLIDHDTGLAWQALAATVAEALPAAPRIGAWRVATLSDLEGLGLSILLDGPVSVLSATYQALTFFSAGQGADHACLFPAALGCVAGWWNATPGSASELATFEVAGYGYGPVDSGSVHVHSTTTIGSYSQAFCGDLCAAGYGFFTVRAVPEPPTLLLLITGLALVRTNRWQRSV